MKLPLTQKQLDDFNNALEEKSKIEMKQAEKNGEDPNNYYPNFIYSVQLAIDPREHMADIILLDDNGNEVDYFPVPYNTTINDIFNGDVALLEKWNFTIEVIHH